MPYALNNLRRNVSRRPAVSVSPICDLFREPKVYQLKMPVNSQHNVLWLQISVHYILLMQILQCAYDLRQIEQKCFLIA